MATDPKDFNSPAAFRSRIEKSKRVRQDLILGWTDNVMFRRGKPFTNDSDEDRINVNLDWPNTKAKHAALFSQVPTVQLTPKRDAYAPVVAPFAKVLNDELSRANVDKAIDEALLDCINASGIGAVQVGYERRTEQIEVPAIDIRMLPPELQMQLLASGEVPMEKVDRTTSDQFTIRRISPSDLLWPVEFTGSNFDDAPWIGRSGLMPWAEAKNQFGLKDSDRDKVVGASSRTSLDSIRGDEDEHNSETEGMVEYDEVFYWSHRYDPNEKYFKAIRHLVFVSGLEQPVVDEPWRGQQFDQVSGVYLGSCKFPIRVLTLTYISDDAIPPSDTAVGRPQVLELIKFRTNMALQRDRSIPLRWFNTNLTDPAMAESLMRGVWQGMIPTQGDGSRIVGEVPRTAFPREGMEGDRVAKQDLDRVWQTGDNQAGSFASGERSASEANIVQANFQTRIGYERARVGDFFVGIAEVLAGLIALYGDFDILSPEDAQRLEQGWDRSKVNQEFVYFIRPDSTVRLEAGQRVQQLMGILNIVGQSGFVNPEPIIREIVSLGGLDPTAVMTKPNPPSPQPINISIRNAEDLQNPIVLALLARTGQLPSPQELEAAKNMLVASYSPPQGPQGPPQMGGAPPVPAAPGPPNDVPEGNQWGVMPKINRRGDFE